MKIIRIEKYYWPVIITLVLWTLWCIIMRAFPSISDEENLLRAVIRIGVVLIPSIVYAKLMYPKNASDILGLKNHKRGLLFGFIISLTILLGYYLFLIEYQQQTYNLPKGLARWANWIIISPLAEEILFRAILFQELKKKYTLWSAIFISSLFFVLIHLPPIIFLDSMDSTIGILSYCGQLLLVSIVLTYAFYKSKSLWGSVLPHWTNNLISMGIVR